MAHMAEPEDRRVAGFVIILMGVSGAGKSTVGARLAQELGWTFLDGDELHPARNREVMSHGIALTDADRQPWLDAMRQSVERFLSAGANAVIACSALKESYRRRIVVDPSRVKVVYLKGPQELVASRLRDRPRALHASQASAEPVRRARGAARRDRGRYLREPRRYRRIDSRATRNLTARGSRLPSPALAPLGRPLPGQGEVQIHQAALPSNRSWKEGIDRAMRFSGNYESQSLSLTSRHRRGEGASGAAFALFLQTP